MDQGSDMGVAGVLLGVAEGLHEGMVVLDRDWCYRYVNPVGATMLGTTVEDLLGNRYPDLYPEAEGTGFQRAYARVLATGEPEVLDQEYAPWGRWFRNRVLPCDIGIVVFFTDVTEERRRTQQLQRLAVLEQLVDHADALIVVHDLQGRYLYANEACAVGASTSAAGMVGRTAEEVFGPEVGSRSRERELAVQASARPMHLQEDFALPDGTTRTFLSVRFPVFDADGVLTATGAVLTDISGWQLTRGDLALSEQRLRDAFTHTTLGHVVVDQVHGTVLEANTAAARMLGVTVEELLAGPVPQVVDAEAYRSLARRSRALGEHGFEIETRVRRPDGGELPVLATVTALGDGSTASFILRDLTPLHELQRRLVDAERLEAVGAVAGGVAHDVNNVLAAVGGYADLLEPEVAGRGAAERHVAGIQRSVARASDFVDRLLAFARRQELEATDLDLASTTADLADMCLRLLPVGVDLLVTGRQEGVAVRADGSQVQQVLLNLVLNARDALGPDGGTVRVEVDDVVLDGAAAGSLAPGRYARARVVDDGPGMTPDVARRCFEPFFTTRRRTGGHGLGLSTALGIARQSGGDLRLVSAPGEGTTSTLLLPLAPSVMPSDADPVTDLAPDPALDPVPAHADLHGALPAGAGGRQGSPAEHRPARERGTVVLVVDDDDAVRETVGRSLAAGGHEVVLASGGTEALRLAVGLDRRLGLLLTDLDMPEGDGPTLVRLARRLLDPALPVVVMSALAPSPPVPGTVFLAKPFPREVLLRTVDGMLGEGPAGGEPS